MLSDGQCADPTSIFVDLVRAYSWYNDINNGNHKITTTMIGRRIFLLKPLGS